MTTPCDESRSHRRDKPGTVNILGVNVAEWTADRLIDAMIRSATRRSVGTGQPLSTVHYANVHVVNTAYHNRRLRDQLARASTVYCDGSGVRLGAALLGERLLPRLTAADWIEPFCERAASAGVSVFLLGSAEGVAASAARVLQRRHPHLRLVGAHHGFLDDQSSAAVIANVNVASPDVLLVGMGTPLQELWLERYRSQIEAPVVWTVGALFDFVAGVQRRAPKWLSAMHMEWLWRVATDPRRLGRRYLLGNPLFCTRILQQRVRGLPAHFGG